MRSVRSLAAVLLLCTGLIAGRASADSTPVQRIWRLLDYLAVDYSGAVADGKVVSEVEYGEMKEFAASAKQRIAELPASPALADLQQQAAELDRLIADKAHPASVATSARGLAAALIAAYPVPLAPAHTPDFERGAVLYAQNCASCHGASGHADGPLAAGLDPRPIAFADETRARERSIFALYQVIEQGLEGTSMSSFAHLPAADRWALAFFVGSLAYPAERVEDGRALWNGDAALREGFDLQKLVRLTPASLASTIGEPQARQLTSFLRRHPEATAASRGTGSLALARTRLGEALAAYQRGERGPATDLALSAYLDGFEPVEPLLSARDKALMLEIEGAMAEVRAAITRRDAVAAVQDRIATLDALFARAEAALADESSGTSSFLAAFTILLREGLEAILIVMAVISFLHRAGRRDALPYVHGGWVTALLAGGATWVAATWLITISGAGRELTEGFGGVFAALVLLWVGIWMHGKSTADAWQRYIREKLGRALTRRSAWFLFAIVFVVVYREVFETILFYAAISNQENIGTVIAGALSAILVLAAIAAVMQRYGRILPIGKFFAYSSALIAVLAVVLIGKGSAALQEAGYLPIDPLPLIPRSELLGIFPTRETVLAQVVMAVLLGAGFAYNRAAAKKRSSPAAPAASA